MAARWRGEGGQHRGARPYQEDSWALKTLNDGTLLAVVADGMGSTVVAAIVAGDEVRWISVGDSPFYVLLDGKLQRLNADHSMAPQIDALVARGVISAEEGADHPGRHTLREAVMGEPLALIDEGTRRLPSNALLLLCSDGVLSLSDADIASQSAKPVSVLISAVLAVRNPHQDNVTVIKLERTS